ncbi:hypothetical protein [Luteolibacter marinus]|uniref:hypothetical protein n=1 Tax=Luteolibacter marinus TaxID=2776705 RepID=UPI0018682CA3|nr:hypothetical protein [Luteolibacter marinus]
MGYQLTTEINATRELDPMLEAVADFIAEAKVLQNGADLTDFTAANVTVIPPEATNKEIEQAVQHAIGKHKGLSLLVIAGGGKNPDPLAPGPQMTVEMELQLYVHPRLRQKGSRSALELVVALMRGLHDAQIRPTGLAWYEEIRALSFDPIPDDDFTAYSLQFEREQSF